MDRIGVSGATPCGSDLAQFGGHEDSEIAQHPLCKSWSRSWRHSTAAPWRVKTTLIGHTYTPVLGHVAAYIEPMDKVLTSAEARELFASIDPATPAGLRDRALLGAMVYCITDAIGRQRLPSSADPSIAGGGPTDLGNQRRRAKKRENPGSGLRKISRCADILMCHD